MVKGRKEQRLAAVLPVRVVGRDRRGVTQTLIAHTVDLSLHGAQICGMNTEFPAGQLVFIQRRTVKCQFQVRWCKAQSDGTWAAGLRCLEPEKNIWDLSFGDATPDSPEVIPFRKPEESVKPAAFTDNRRAHERIACDLGVELLTLDRTTRTWARCTDLSPSGCYIKTRSPSIPCTRLVVQFADVPNRPCVVAQVRTCDPALGMGLTFTDIRDADRVVLLNYIASLRIGNSSSTPAADEANTEPLQSALQLCRELEERLSYAKGETTSSSSAANAVALPAELHDAMAIAIFVIAPALSSASKPTVQQPKQNAMSEVVDAAIKALHRLNEMLKAWEQKREPEIVPVCKEIPIELQREFIPASSVDNNSPLQ